MNLADASIIDGDPWSEAIFTRARQRQEQAAGAYAGAVTPPEAWTLFKRGAVRLIDVRTAPELQYVGRVTGSIHVQWHGADAVPVFLERLRELAPPGTPLLLLCRSAVRSHHAAAVATAAGWIDVFNVLEGFEGQRNHVHQRGLIDGWRHHGLPWVQD